MAYKADDRIASVCETDYLEGKGIYQVRQVNDDYTSELLYGSSSKDDALDFSRSGQLVFARSRFGWFILN